MQPEGSIIELCHVTRDLDAALLHWTRDLGAGPFFVFDVPVLPGCYTPTEMLQAFALVHDDVMDGSAMRRSARTAHLAYGDQHVDAEWRGDPRRFGEAAGRLARERGAVLVLTGAPADRPLVDAARAAVPADVRPTQLPAIVTLLAPAATLIPSREYFVIIRPRIVLPSLPLAK